MPLGVLTRSWSAPDGLPREWQRRRLPVLLVTLPLALAVIVLVLIGRPHVVLPALRGRLVGAGGGSSGRGAAWPVTSDRDEWVQLPHAYSFQPSQSQCLLHPDGALGGWVGARPTCVRNRWRLPRDASVALPALPWVRPRALSPARTHPHPLQAGWSWRLATTTCSGRPSCGTQLPCPPARRCARTATPTSPRRCAAACASLSGGAATPSTRGSDGQRRWPST